MNIFKLHCSAQFCVSLAYGLVAIYFLMLVGIVRRIQRCTKLSQYVTAYVEKLIKISFDMVIFQKNDKLNICCSKAE